jgi:hypothetical protein
MIQNEYYNISMEKIKNKEPIKLDLLNGVILELTYDREIKAYRGYWREEDIQIGIWELKTLAEIISGETKELKIL